MQPPGLIRPIYSFKGTRIRGRRKLIGNREKKLFFRGKKDRKTDRAMKRGEKHLFRIFLYKFLIPEV